eukprot:TRINITY_DN2279_c0_g1_i2.p2 TRINITY_DN2279_c0_g1~~TRINITY_DN2279_c0_g1_i2.p2  ORF type:complete len:188 (+),score=93.38 TRINITY_DN2279_c0_g1_i2:69-566(+)
MGDDQDTEVQVADSGASLTYPIQAGALKKGMMCVIKGRPVKIVDYTTSKTGKHGHAKAHIVAIDIFTDKKLEELCPTSHNMEAPVVKKQVFTVIDANDQDNTCSLQDDDGEIHDGHDLPKAGDGSNTDVRKLMVQAVENGDELFVTLVSAMGESHILEAKKGKGE